MVYPQATKMPSGALDVSKHDLSVCGSLGQLRVVVLFLFVSRVLDYLKEFRLDDKTVSSAKGSAKRTAEEAVTSVSDLSSSLPIVFLQCNICS